MSKLNLSIFLNSYADDDATNSPSLSNIKWHRDLQGIEVNEPISKTIRLGSGQSQSLFSSEVVINSDNTTTYDIALKSGTANTYKISHNSGTAPEFRTPRVIGSDITTEVTITKNAKLLIFTATGGTLFDLSSVSVGDSVRIGSVFNAANQGVFKIIMKSTTSFAIENEIGQAEGPIVLGADFADQINIYSSDGVQIGDKIDIVDGFSLVSRKTFEITDVSHDYIEFYSICSIPEESNISNDPESFSIFSSAKQIVYIESDKSLDIAINGIAVTNSINPIALGSSIKPGMLLITDTIKSLIITNTSLDMATVFVFSAE